MKSDMWDYSTLIYEPDFFHQTATNATGETKKTMSVENLDLISIADDIDDNIRSGGITIYELNQFFESVKGSLEEFVDQYYEVGQVIEFEYNDEVIEGDIVRINDRTVTVITDDRKFRIQKVRFPSMISLEW